MVFGWVLLFVSRFVFFIDDDEPQIAEWGKDGGTGADDDAGLTGADTVPFVETFPLGKVGMLHRDFVAQHRKASLETAHGLRGERDFG